MPHTERFQSETPHIQVDQIDTLHQLFPTAFTEGKIDFEKLRLLLGDTIEERQERYSFSWAGKRDALRLLQTPTRATLTPCPAESVNFDSTQNVFIEGDNLEVLKLLYKAYFGRIKLIYIDPPYNTGNDFVYPDNYTDPLATYLQLTGQQDAEGNLLTSNPESSGRFHSAWLSMMYPRLFIARQLLREDGMIFVSVDDKEIYNLRILLNEIFGEENFVECFIWKKSYGGGAKEKYAVTQHEYILTYAKNMEMLDELWLPPDEDAEKRYYKYRDENGPYRIKPLEATASMDNRPNLVYPIPNPKGGEVWPKRQWWWSKERVMRALEANELVFTGSGEKVSVSYKQYLYDKNGEKRGAKPFSVIEGIYTQHGTDDLRKLFNGNLVLQFPKPVNLIKKIISMGTNSQEYDLVLDFFAGSSTTAQSLFEINREDNGNRRFILVQLPEPTGNSDYATIAEIGEERIRNVIARMKQERDGQLPLDRVEDLGFRVFKLALSNFRDWAGSPEAEPEAYAEQMALFNDPLEAGWDEQAVICEVALKEGYGLNLQVEPAGEIPQPDGTTATIYRVTDPDRSQHFYITLAAALQPEQIHSLALVPETLLVCRDIALNDEGAANLALQFRLKTI